MKFVNDLSNEFEIQIDTEDAVTLTITKRIYENDLRLVVSGIPLLSRT